MSSDEKEQEITYKVAWRKNDEQITKDAIQFWMEGKSLQNPAQGVERAKVLCVVAYEGDKLVAVSTTFLGMQENVRCRAFHFRCIVHPEYRRRGIATELAKRCLEVTEEWSKENPSIKALAFVIRVETQDLVIKCYQPVWGGVLNFTGYTQQGLPVYLKWFKHANFGNPNEDPDFTFYPQRPGSIGAI